MRALNDSWSESLAWVLLASLLIVGLPLFVCMPVWLDASLYDLAARNLCRGGIPYRDIFDTNFPGMVWLHVAIRKLFGWRSETIRLVDIAFLTAIVCLLADWLRPLGQRRCAKTGSDPLKFRGSDPVFAQGLTRAARLWVAVACCAFYLSTSEWVHCQRDVWMLLPALTALHLRRRQMADLLQSTPSPPGRLVVRALVEGLCWGAAFWIKPYVAVPALACWLFATAYLRRAMIRSGRVAVLDAAFVLAGVLLAGGLGVLWLWSSGTWPYFWDVFRNWNPDYYLTTEGHGLLRALYVLLTLAPWGAVHLVALPIAASAIYQVLKAPSQPYPSPSQCQRWPLALLGAFYLGWLLQAGFLQTSFDYVLAPTVLLALTLVVGQLWLSGPSLAASTLLAVFTALAAARHPLLEWERTALWGRCWAEGSTGELRDRLTLIGRRPRPTGWNDLQRVAVYLRGLHLRDGELTCFNNLPHVLYLELDLQPSTRFLHFDTVLQRLPHHREAVRQELAASRQRFVVSDLRAVGLDGSQLTAESPGQPLALPPGFPQDHKGCYPWYEPIVFRSGRFLVHQVTGPVRSLSPDD